MAPICPQGKLTLSSHFSRHHYWKNDEAVILEKGLLLNEKWPGTVTTFSYTYSKTTKEALPWTPELQQ
jgi:hypothetical protein